MTFTVIVVTRDRVDLLLRCLESLGCQRDTPQFDVVVVDDGSIDPVSTVLEDMTWPFPLTVVRQIPLGIASARNLGATTASGDVLVYLDSDCVAAPYLLSSLHAAAQQHPTDVAFQLQLTGGDDCASDRLEGIRLASTLDSMRTNDGHVAYVNTSGFAIRRDYAVHSRLFDTALVRGEDTGLLADLIHFGQTPVLAKDAVVSHRPTMPLHRYVMKHFSIGYRAGPVRTKLRQMRVRGRVRVSRWAVFRQIARRAASSHRGAFFDLPALMLCYAFEYAGRAAHAAVGIRPGRTPLLTTIVDVVRDRELLDRILWSSEHRVSLVVTYVNARSLAYARLDPEFASTLRSSDLVYADGMGAVLALLLTRARRSHKVTANDNFLEFCTEVAHRHLTVAFVGGSEDTIRSVRAGMAKHAPGMSLVCAESGFFPAEEEHALVEQLRRVSPSIVVLGMGQPKQEEFALRLRDRLPQSAIWCVGGLFEVLTDPTYRPPRWMRTWGFEWLYRLKRQPGHCWRRYALGLPFLAMLIVEDLLRRGGRAVLRRGAWTDALGAPADGRQPASDARRQCHDPAAESGLLPPNTKT